MVRQVRQLRAAAEAARHQRRESHILDKTRICRFFAKGQCSRGEACSFAHGVEELHAQPDLFRTEMCFDFARSGTCRAGDSCKFAHTLDELRPMALQTGPTADGRTSAEGTLLADPGRVRRQIEVMQKQAKKLQEQMQALQHTADQADRSQKKAPALRRCGSHTSTAADEEEFHGPGVGHPSVEGNWALFNTFSRNNSMTSEDWEVASSANGADCQPKPVLPEIHVYGAPAADEDCLRPVSRMMMGAGTPVMEFSRQTSLSVDEWEAGSASAKTDRSSVDASGSSHTGSSSSARDQVPGLVSVVVRNTFIDFAPLAPGHGPRRAHSVPAAPADAAGPR